jgi:hypothetical protein
LDFLYFSYKKKLKLVLSLVVGVDEGSWRSREESRNSRGSGNRSGLSQSLFFNEEFSVFLEKALFSIEKHFFI